MSKRKTQSTMTVEEVRALVRAEAADHLSTENHHNIALGHALVDPQRISIIVRTVRDGKVRDREETVWLVGSGPRLDGYKIVMREDGMQYGLASPGFPIDKHPILCGWYGGLLSAFVSM